MLFIIFVIFYTCDNNLITRCYRKLTDISLPRDCILPKQVCQLCTRMIGTSGFEVAGTIYF